MRSKIVAIGSIFLGGVIATDNGASACLTTDGDTDSVDRALFQCQGAPNPLPDPITGQMNPQPSIFFAPAGRPATPLPQGCNSPLVVLDPIPALDCQNISCPDPNALQGTGNRQWSFFIQHDDRWHLDNNEWSGNGKSDTVFYDANQPYSKMLNAAYVVYFGLKDDPDKQLHGTQDYVNELAAPDNDYHSKFFRSMDLTDGNLGKWSISPTIIGDDEINLACSLFDTSGGVDNNIIFRIDTNLHEAWHAWEHANIHFGSIDHKDGPQGSCSVSGEEVCDPFYSHDLASYHPFGRLKEGGFSTGPGCAPQRFCAGVIDPNHFHSPTQVEWEFMCDLVASHADWVTNDIVFAAGVAQNLDTQYFIQTPPFDCGVMSPI